MSNSIWRLTDMNKVPKKSSLRNQHWLSWQHSKKSSLQSTITQSLSSLSTCGLSNLMAQVIASATEEQRHKDDVQCIALGDNCLFSASYDGVIKKWSLDLGEVIHQWKAFEYPVNALLSPENSGKVYAADCDGHVHVYDQDGQLTRKISLKSHLSGKECDIKAMDNRDNFIFLADSLGTVMRFDLEMNRTHSVDTFSEIWSLAATGDERVLVARDNYVMNVELGSVGEKQGGRSAYDVQKQHFFGSPIGAVLGDDLGSTSAGVSPATEGRSPVIANEEFVACTERTGMRVKVVYNKPDFAPHQSHGGHDMIINCLGFLGPHKLLSSGWDGQVLLYSLQSTESGLVSQTAVDGYVNCMAPVAKADVVYVGGKNGMVHKIRFGN